MAALGFIRQVPKPILMGALGAMGGLFAAVFIGELLWWLLKPAPPVAAAPRIAVSASPNVHVYQGLDNTFAVEWATEKPEGPVDIRFDALPSGVEVRGMRASGERTQAQATVRAFPEAKPGKYPITVLASTVTQGKTITAETTMEIIVDPLAVPMVDIVFVLDVTGSMEFAITGVKNGIQDFADALRKKQLAARVALLAFGDRTIGEEPKILMFNAGQSRSPFTTDMTEFRQQVGNLSLVNGGDPPESSLDGMVEATRLPYRQKATRVMILITDAAPKLPDKETKSLQQASIALRDSKINQLHFVTMPQGIVKGRGEMQSLTQYEEVRNGAGIKGKFFDLRTVQTQRDAFAKKLMPELSTEIASAVAASQPETRAVVAAAEAPAKVQSLQSTEAYSADQTVQLFAVGGLWTAVIAAAISVLLACGQMLYQGKAIPISLLLLAGAGGAVAGVIGGTAGQLLYAFIPDIPVLGQIFRIIGWLLLGGLVGFGLAFVVPNLRKRYGIIGGVVGGLIGAIAFLVCSLVADALGRIVGAAVLGMCIGLMVAIVEAAFRSAYLEVKLGARETITVNLGPEPVKIGGDARACTIFARGAAPIALKFWIRDGQVICHDSAIGEQAVSNGVVKQAGSVEVTVRTSSSSRSATPPPSKPTPPPRPAPFVPAAVPPVAAPAPVPPVAAPRPAPVPAPAIARPTVGPIAKPTLPSMPSSGAKPIVPPIARPSASPPPVAPPAQPTGPKARCTECGAVVEGKAGMRICKQCGAIS